MTAGSVTPPRTTPKTAVRTEGNAKEQRRGQKGRRQELGVRDQGWKGGAASPQPPHQMSKRPRVARPFAFPSLIPDS